MTQYSHRICDMTIRNTPYLNTIGHVLVTSPETLVGLHIPVYCSLTKSPQVRQLSKAVPFQTGIQTPSVLWLHHLEKVTSRVTKERICRAHAHSQMLLCGNNPHHFCSDYCPELVTWLHLIDCEGPGHVPLRSGRKGKLGEVSISQLVQRPQTS